MAAQLVKATRAAGLAPALAYRGYWPTVRLLWDTDRIEVEVFGSGFELYEFPDPAEGGPYEVTEFDADKPEVLSILVGRISALLRR